MVTHVLTITYPFSDCRTKLTVNECRFDPLEKRNTISHMSLEKKKGGDVVLLMYLSIIYIVYNVCTTIDTIYLLSYIMLLI